MQLSFCLFILAIVSSNIRQIHKMIQKLAKNMMNIII